jgi:glyoxylase-like metal-dependent hydrolase (beta-lactamase superfamily II)
MMKLHSIDTELFKLDGGAMFGVVPKVIWNRLNPADADNLCTWAMRCLLIEDGDRLILVDNGVGDKQDAKFFGHYHLHGPDTLTGSLRKLGFHHQDITDVFLTHLHFDHCGGSVMREGDRLLPAFPNAQYWSNARHWDWAVRPNDREKASFLKENILPIEESGQLSMLPVPDAGTAVFSSGIRVRYVHGHTEAMMLPQIEYKGRTIVYMADLIPSVWHLPMAWVMAYDMFPMTTLSEKRSFLEEAVDNDWVLFFEHDPLHECCTLHRTEKGIRMKEHFPLSAL